MCRMWFHGSKLNCALLLLLLQLLIGFECGVVVLWDLKSKKADYRYNYDEVRHYFHSTQSCEDAGKFVHGCLNNMFGLVRFWILTPFTCDRTDAPKYFVMKPEIAVPALLRFCPRSFHIGEHNEVKAMLLLFVIHVLYIVGLCANNMKWNKTKCCQSLWSSSFTASAAEVRKFWEKYFWFWFYHGIKPVLTFKYAARRAAIILLFIITQL